MFNGWRAAADCEFQLGGSPEVTMPRAPVPFVVIEDDVLIGIGAIVLKGVRICRGARVGAGAVITADVPPGAVMIGNPARPSANLTL